jgi:hypothetical protein
LRGHSSFFAALSFAAALPPLQRPRTPALAALAAAEQLAKKKASYRIAFFFACCYPSILAM